MGIFRKVKKGFFSTFIVWRDEFQKVYKDLGVLMFFVIAPLGYPILYSLIYNNEVVHEVEAVVVDDSNTKESREFRRNVDASNNVNIVGVCANMQEAREAMKKHEAYGIIEIPRDFSVKIGRGEQTYVRFYADMGSLLYYKAILLTLTDVSMDMNVKIQEMRAGNKTDKDDEIFTSPLKYEEVAFFNQKNGYGSFLVPAVLVLIIQQMILLGITMASGTDRENNRYHALIPLKSHYFGTMRILTGKTLCYLIVWVIMTVYLLWLIPKIFNFPQEGNPWDIIGFACPFVLSSIFFAITMSALVREREAGFVVFVCTSVIFLFMSGISWPLYAMPEGWVWVAKLIPGSAGIQGFIKITTMGATLSDIRSEYMHLWYLTVFYFITSWFYIRHEVNRSIKLLNGK